jgi:hypothetical protein
MAESYSAAAVAMGHLAPKRAIRRAQCRRYVTVNAAEFADTPKGQPGRPSRSLTLEQAAALLMASEGAWSAYISRPAAGQFAVPSARPVSALKHHATATLSPAERDQLRTALTKIIVQLS